MEELSLHELYDIEETALYILRNSYTRVALQFPDQLLEASVVVSSALRNELRKKIQSNELVQLYVLADTTYGSCCADEIAAAHVQAECIIHYGHTCFSPMSKLPVWYVFGKAMIDIKDFVHQLVDYAHGHKKRVLVVFDLKYVHAIQHIVKKIVESQLQCGRDGAKIVFADVPERETYPVALTSGPTVGAGKVDSKKQESDADNQKSRSPSTSTIQSCTRFSLGGLSWTLPEGSKMEDIELVWIGQECPALTNVMLTFNASTVSLYDPERKLLATDAAKQSKFLMRRYYLVERAKDANIVGIVVGTLGVAGYQEMVRSLKRLVKESGKKSYILAMGRPNPAKLANFPECDIFVLVACAQTALLDSKEYMVPVITPFEAMIAWKRGSDWTGEYSLDFSLLKNFRESEEKAGRSIQLQDNDEARFSFIKGSYVEERMTLSGHECDSSKSICLAREAERALQIQNGSNSELSKRPEVQSGAEYFALRSFQGLQLDDAQRPVQHYAVGQKGRAAAYSGEPAKQLG
ncbi:hypothetical protein GOP47_0022666 [Adiantum capillus-veneris]|uniref:2-(3-amino-3-carboxypropyl)histidine synthase subunit 2 n=1 Tax=Adiantum capillus-veneris TaxID=13818 RepID=A0A9D4U6W9_ADICA|nr:hypothetical protein GOP47_0022666 [Adiantum capillus-veneris]